MSNKPNEKMMNEICAEYRIFIKILSLVPLSDYNIDLNNDHNKRA